MKKASAIVRICVWGAVLLIALCVLLGVVLGSGAGLALFSGKGDAGMNMETTVLKDETFSAEGIDSVRIEGRSEDVRILPSEDGQFRVYETIRRAGVGVLGEPGPAEVGLSGGVFSVRPTGSWFFMGLGFFEHNLDIYVPDTHWKEFSASLASGSLRAGQLTADNISLSCASGRLEGDGFRADETLSLHVTSGKSILRNAACAEADMRTTSGEIQIDGLTAKNLRAELTSGMIRGASVTADVLNLRTASGSLKLEGRFSDISSRVTSGTTSIESAVTPEKLSVESSSGSITCRLPAESVFDVDYRISSGSIHSDFGHSFNGRSGVTGAGDPVYQVKVTSGRVKLVAG